jgi:hypothetical protein
MKRNMTEVVEMRLKNPFFLICGLSIILVIPSLALGSPFLEDSVVEVQKTFVVQAGEESPVPAVTPEMRAAVGTLAAKEVKTPKGSEIVIEGPSAFTENLAGKKPSWYQRILQKAIVWFTFGLAAERLDRWRIGEPKGHPDKPRIQGRDMEALTEPGPDGKPPVLQPGDMIVNGSYGHAGHMTMYVGKDPMTGKPMVIQAMATGNGLQRLVDQLFVNPFRVTGKVGVIKEGLGEFFDRYHRDTAYILRDERLTPEMKKRGIERIESLIGKPYDYSLQLGSDSIYCSELAVEFERAAYAGSEKPRPWIGTTYVNKQVPVLGVEVKEWVAQPSNFAVSDDFKKVWANRAGDADYRHVRETTVSGQ